MDKLAIKLTQITKVNGLRISNRFKYVEKQIELKNQIDNQETDSRLIRQFIRQTNVLLSEYYDELKENGLQEFPEGILKMDSIQYLDLSYNGITHIPQGIIELTKLERLNLSHNKVQFIEQIEWHKLSNLIMINVSGNVRIDIPEKLIEVVRKNNGESKREALIVQRNLAVKNGEYEVAAELRDMQDDYGIIM